jgi:hypothetical protein
MAYAYMTSPSVSLSYEEKEGFKTAINSFPCPIQLTFLRADGSQRKGV